MSCDVGEVTESLENEQLLYENVDYDLTHGFFIHDFNKYIFYYDINFYY